ncbi:MAG TPA: M20/M25/M40 family metallo-hydrolase, partial [Dongiaceae bacterium]|nr:M20/M25/M40 family metallo-hydrolase [Dongiaceae bacterium]
DRIGPRLSGSDGHAAAIVWTQEEFRRDGLDRVRAEKVMVPHWVRGEERAEIVAPVALRLTATALGGSEPTPPDGVTAEVVEVDSLEALAARGDAVRGKIVLFNRQTVRDREGAGYVATSPLRHKGPSEAARRGAVATMVRSLGTLRARLPHTGSLSYTDDAPRIPAAAITEEDADLLHRLLEAGGPVRVRLTLGCRNLPDVESANVVAELRGRAKPDEVVLIGAHLDSWDLGQGSIDDGAGVAIVMEAMRLLRRLDLLPDRTVRAVLYANEENGLRGGKGYVEAHRDELPRHVAAVESDSGGAAPIGLRVVLAPGDEERLRRLATSMAPLGAGEVSAREGGGADIGPLKPFGVPLIGLRQDMTGYFDWHHSAGDTLDKVDPATLAANAAAMAYLAWALARLDPPLARLPPEAAPAAH